MDGTILQFGGDVMLENHIKLLQLPGTAINITEEHTVPTMDHMTHLLAGDPMTAMLGPFAPPTYDVEMSWTCMMVLVPQAYLHLLLDRTLTPQKLWYEVGCTIIVDGKENECAILINWLCTVLTLHLNVTAPMSLLGLANLLGNLATVFPIIHISLVLQAHCRKILHSNLPVLDHSPLALNDQMASLVDMIQHKNATTQQDQADAHACAVALKTPTSTFPQFAMIWKHLVGIMPDNRLPPIYHLWANSTKAERWSALQMALTEQVKIGLGAGWITTFVTKELLKMIFQG